VAARGPRAASVRRIGVLVEYDESDPVAKTWVVLGWGDEWMSGPATCQPFGGSVSHGDLVSNPGIALVGANS
jgi:hypothetical protein